ncbi:hypothetical protein R3X27_17125 [Tropicimonas sp. TH_r6]|uniref:hypothetical protein n=1 Tax=Tropicimonas sp. TH_r6 TaxID=3082085 RepID=UPI002953BA95|nr:hypothetical protein [Tropicimonas sp. TH_r6]MDV7144404.1 hypothetical protein [Tropicimonas sp. TH_r6]
MELASTFSTFPPNGRTAAEIGAAPQHDDRKPVVEPGRVAPNLNRSFAALSTNAKDADIPVVPASARVVGLPCIAAAQEA